MADPCTATHSGAKKVPIPFTDLTVRSLPQGTYFDIKTPAFGIRIGKHRKTWLVVRTKARLKTVVGHYPAMDLKTARAEAKALLIAPAPKPKSAITFEAAKTIFIVENYRDRKATSQKEVDRLLTKHFFEHPWRRSFEHH
jgi:hypothetical protein